MRYYIRSAASVTCQPTFNNPGFSGRLTTPEAGAPLIVPDYKVYINPSQVRRMSEVLRISVACCKHALDASGITEAGAIIAGTGLGCLCDTEKFLNNALTVTGGMLPPTSFIQSTHNTITGQVSLLLENRNYNMTHTQNTLSFERSLEDAFLWLDEGTDNVLAGAADEVIPALRDIFAQLGYTHELATGASFFVLSKQRGDAKAAVKTVAGISGFSGDVNEAAGRFCAERQTGLPDLVLYAGAEAAGLQKTFPGAVLLQYPQYCGVYATSSAFAMHLAADAIAHGTVPASAGHPAKTALIVNHLLPDNLGLIFLQSV